MKPLAAAAITAPTLEMKAAWIVPDEKIIALLFIGDVGRVSGGGPRHMGLAARMKIRFIAGDAADRAGYEKHGKLR